jgi:hypothetical protein
MNLLLNGMKNPSIFLSILIKTFLYLIIFFFYIREKVVTPDNLFNLIRTKKLDLGIPVRNNADDNGGKDVSDQKERGKEYYEYQLAGVVVHSGSLEGGHYFSYIRERKPNRKKNENCEIGKEKREISFPPSSSVQWYYFNDSDVSTYDPNRIPEECFGCEKEIKNPIIPAEEFNFEGLEV